MVLPVRVNSADKVIKAEKISGTGRVVRVCPTYAFLSSDRYGSIYVNQTVRYGQHQTEGGDQQRAENIDHKNFALDRYFCVDDVVHFKAIEQRVVIQKKSESSLSACKFDQQSPLPKAVHNENGIVVEVSDKCVFIWSERLGEVFYPIGARFAAAAHKPSSETQSCSSSLSVVLTSTGGIGLTEQFMPNDMVAFDAYRQLQSNNCSYLATSVRKMSAARSAYVDKTLGFRCGLISKVSPHFGYIYSEQLGSVFFSLSNSVAADQADVGNLCDLFDVGDSVRFIPMEQPEINGCSWRALKVMKMSAADLAQLSAEAAVNLDDRDFASCNPSDSSSRVVERRPKNQVNSCCQFANKACQTLTPPEALLLKAVTKDVNFYNELCAKFPYLMRYIDKSLGDPP
ncbi:unnamed protein product [Soboliphyme baturini]|uniref:SET domain-containing protein n=1 Tax=Soboliphyme baturini TaxID=241478 RepID=A0A183IPU4_9BILA|nr:unnamed protein product [Soboliphyme baturini]